MPLGWIYRLNLILYILRDNLRDMRLAHRGLHPCGKWAPGMIGLRLYQSMVRSERYKIKWTIEWVDTRKKKKKKLSGAANCRVGEYASLVTSYKARPITGGRLYGDRDQLTSRWVGSSSARSFWRDISLRFFGMRRCRSLYSWLREVW